MALVQLIIAFGIGLLLLEAKYVTANGIFEILAKFLALSLRNQGICELLALIFNEPKHKTFFYFGCSVNRDIKFG